MGKTLIYIFSRIHRLVLNWYNFCRESGTTTGVDLTLKEAVEYLSHAEENYQQCGATFIQHASFKEEQAKQEVWALLR